MLTISVVIPVLNGAAFLPRCLESLKRSRVAPLECIVVDDGSSDGSAATAQAAGAVVLRIPARTGPASARNLGAAQASGDLLVFVDADVCVRDDTLSRIRAWFENDPGLDALIGSYDDDPPAPGFVSQYKNLFHHYVHQHGRREAATFWSGCGAIRREVFRHFGGFAECYGRPSIEDIELGYRLRDAGRRIVLDPTLQVKHLKHWTLGTLLRTDIFDRAIPWTGLILRSTRLPNDLNVAVSQRVSAALVLAAAALVVLGLATDVPLVLACLPLAGAVLLNRKFYAFLAGRKGWAFLTGAVPLHLAYFLYSTLAFAGGTILYLPMWRRQAGKSREARPPALIQAARRDP